MRKGYLSRRIYTSPVTWMRNAVLMVDEETASCSLMELEGTEPPATTFVDGVILPFEPNLQCVTTLKDLLLRQFPQEKTFSHYWLLEYPGLFSDKEIPADLSLCKVVKLW